MLKIISLLILIVSVSIAPIASAQVATSSNYAAPECVVCVPGWIKNTAGWWADDKISEVEFVNAIQYLIKHGIIIVNYGSTCANDLSEIFGDQITMVQDICDSHESSDYSELVPFTVSSNFNSNELSFS